MLKTLSTNCLKKSFVNYTKNLFIESSLTNLDESLDFELKENLLKLSKKKQKEN